MAEVISNVGNRYIIGKESTYGTLPGAITALDFGHVQSISVDEDETSEEISSMNSGHTAFDFSDDLYNVSGQIVTKITKAALPEVLEALCGATALTSVDQYTITTDPVSSDDLSYYMKFNTQAGKTMHMLGIAFTAGEITVEKDGSIEMTLTYQAQILSPQTEALSPSTNVGALFRGLDATVSYDGNTTILDNFTLTLDWNLDLGDSRGIEAAHANGRRVIKRVIRNNLTLGGSFESQMDANIDTGYEGERTGVEIILLLSRGADNDHTFTISTARTSTRSRELNNDNTSKKLTCDFVGTDVTVVGDL